MFASLASSLTANISQEEMNVIDATFSPMFGPILDDMIQSTKQDEQDLNQVNIENMISNYFGMTTKPGDSNSQTTSDTSHTVVKEPSQLTTQTWVEEVD